MDTCACENDDVTTSILIPSIASALATPTNHTPFCSGRIHHAAVYDASSDVVYLSGGVDFSGVLCSGDMVQVNLGPLRSGGVGSGAWGGSAVMVIGRGGAGPTPDGRYLHTASLVQVSDFTVL